jgi:methyl-accepting chemotaxis protein
VTISRLLYLGFGIIVGLFVVGGVIAHRQIRDISNAQAQIAEVATPLQEAFLEMEISALETARGVVSYVKTHDFEDIWHAMDSAKGFERYFGIFQELATTKEQRDLAKEVSSLYGDLITTGVEIMTLSDQQAAHRRIIRDYARSMGELIDEELLKPVDQTAENAAVQKMEAALKMAVNVHTIHSIYEAYMLERDAGLELTLSDAQQEIQRFIALYRETNPTPEEEQALNLLMEDLDKVTEVGSRIIAATQEIEGSLERFHKNVVNTDRILDDKVQPLIARQVRTAREQARRSTHLATTVILLGAVVGSLFGCLISVVIQRRVTRPLTNMAAAMTPIARGDLRNPDLVESADETGQLAAAFNQMVRSLRDILAESQAMTEEVAGASSEIATTAVQFESTMQEFADRARAVQQAAEETGKRSDEGRGLTRESVTRIDRVRENAEAARRSVLDLSEQMLRINEVTSSVNEIAEQTKLLSLNASIEAARAGEEGRGFAVVATQVRELANQSKEAAGRIESIVSQTQKSVQTVVAKIEQGSRLSEESREIVTRMKEAFDEIATAVYQTIEAMQQIAAGAKDQERGMTELVGGIAPGEIELGEAWAAAPQTQKSIAAIDERIRTLKDRMGKFKT